MQVKPNSPKCSPSQISKNGKIKGVQSSKCKECQYQFTQTILRGRPAAEKAMAVTLYLMGVSMTGIGRLPRVPTPAVLERVAIEINMQNDQRAYNFRYHVSSTRKNLDLG